MNRGERRQLRRFTTFLALCLLAVLLPASLVAGTADGDMPKLTAPASRDKCPVCGMFVTKYPDWTTAILFRDGSRLFFDGAKDLFKCLLDLKRYAPAKKVEDIQAVMVKDYYRLTFMNARKAWFVLGSDVYGPMGRELIPLEKEADAREFMKDHKGKSLLKFSDVTAEIIKTLD
jgi:copper chaperone NosL